MLLRESFKLWVGLHTIPSVDISCNKKEQSKYCYPIYTPEEVVEFKIPVKDWRHCQAGDWGVSDDNYTSQCISVKGKIYRFIAGSATEGNRFLVEERIRTGNFSDLSSRPHVEREIRKERTKRTVRAYARMLISGTIDWEKLANIYRTDQKIPIATVKRLLKLKGIARMLREELDKLLTGQGLTPEYTLSKIKVAMELAEKGKQPIAMLRGAEFLADLQHLNDKQTATLELGMSGEFFDRVKSLQGGAEPAAELVEHTVASE